jgi:hypothetical protein
MSGIARLDDQPHDQIRHDQVQYLSVFASIVRAHQALLLPKLFLYFIFIFFPLTPTRSELVVVRATG